MMKSKSLVGLFALIVFLWVCSSCESYRARRLSRCAIALPDSLEFIYSGEATVRHLDMSLPPDYKQVILVDSFECSFCRVQKLQRYRDLFEEAIEGRKFDLMVILSPKREEASSLREFLLAHDFSLPVYLDPEHLFLDMNPSIPSDARFHSFLMDSSGHPVYVGDPLKGNRAYKQFEKLIDR